MDVFNFLHRFSGSRLTDFRINVPDKQFNRIVINGLHNIITEAKGIVSYSILAKESDYELTTRDIYFKTGEYPVQRLGIKIKNTEVIEALRTLKINTEVCKEEELLMVILLKSDCIPSKIILNIEKTGNLKNSIFINLCTM